MIKQIFTTLRQLRNRKICTYMYYTVFIDSWIVDTCIIRVTIQYFYSTGTSLTDQAVYISEYASILVFFL